MKRAAFLIVGVIACSSDKTARTGEPVAGPAKAAAAVEPPVALESLISADVSGLMRGTAADFPLLAIVENLLGTPVPPCWTKLRASVTVAYQFEIAPQRTSYAVLDGGGTRADAEACARTLPAELRLQVRRQDETLVVTTDMMPGELHLAWRGGFVIAGNRDQVAVALRGAPADLAARWRERMLALPRAGLAAWRDDAVLTNLLGVTTTQYFIAFDGTKTPTPTFTLRVIALYATPGDAAIAARKIKAAEIEPRLAPPSELIAAIKKFKVTQRDTSVDIVMDYSMFEQAGVDVAVMQQWIAAMTAQQR